MELFILLCEFLVRPPPAVGQRPFRGFDVLFVRTRYEQTRQKVVLFFRRHRNVHPPSVAFGTFEEGNFMGLPRHIHNVLQVILSGAFGVIPRLVEDTIQDVPNGLGHQMRPAAAVVQIGVVCEKTSGP